MGGSPAPDRRVALVTGGGRGLGRAIAMALAADGADVVICGRDEAALRQTVAAIEQAGGTCTPVVADVTSAADLENVVDGILGRSGGLDIVVANSGVAGPTGPLWEIDPEEWDSTFAVNVRGVFLTLRAAVPALRRGGSIVIVGSYTGKRPLPGRSAYAASKTALIGLTRTLAHELGPRGVRINLVSPGGVEGERIDGVVRRVAETEGISLAEARERFTAASPQSRLVVADEVARAVLYLASDAASGTTGEDLNVSAGAVTY